MSHPPSRPLSCIYCQSQPANTVDHVPPELIFAKPYPPDLNLITVPACVSCNSGFQRDDEYFRAVLAMRADIEPQSGAANLIERTVRGLRRDAASGLREYLKGTLTTKAVYSEAGIYLGDADAYEVDNERLVTTLRRIVRGLYWHERRVVLPLDATIYVHLTLDEDDDQRRDAKEMIRGRPIVRKGDSFAYVWAPAPDRDHLSAWVLEFYRQVPFLAIVAAPADMVASAAVST